jgi:feruloyl esterase
MDSTDPDLSRYAARGGKLILKENMSDHGKSPFNGIAYYKSVVEKLGQANVDSFTRFYVTPGANHLGSGVSSVDGAALPQGVDLLEAIDSWTDRGAAPGPLVQVAQESNPPFAVTASRPMCRYPQWPRYWAARRRTPRAFHALGKTIRGCLCQLRVTNGRADNMSGYVRSTPDSRPSLRNAQVGRGGPLRDIARRSAV